MKTKYLLAVLAVAAIAALSIGIASAHGTSAHQRGIMNEGAGMMGMDDMMGMTGMMDMMQFHDEDADWMRKEMKEHMNVTDKEFDEMAEHCPMMRKR